jgi:hypothetical protein
MPAASERAAGAVEQRLLTGVLRHALHLGRSHWKSPVADGGDGCGGGRSYDSGGRIYRKEYPGLKRCGGDQCHHGHEAFEQHGSVSHCHCVAFSRE